MVVRVRVQLVVVMVRLVVRVRVVYHQVFVKICLVSARDGRVSGTTFTSLKDRVPRSQIKRERIRGCIPPLDGVLRRGRRLVEIWEFFRSKVKIHLIE